MQIRPTLSAPATRPGKVTDIPFDRGTEYYNKRDGSLAERPSTRGLITLNLKTLQAAETKIQAIQNRAAELQTSGQAKPDGAGNLKYSNAETGETLTVATQDGAKIYEQSFASRHQHWFKREYTVHAERFEVRGDETQVSVGDSTDEQVHFLIPLSKHDVSDVNQSFKYTKTAEGMKFWHSDAWHLAK